jgi:hypothetical protein
MFSPTRAHHHSPAFQRRQQQEQLDNDSLSIDEMDYSLGGGGGVELNSHLRLRSSSPRKSVSASEFRQWLKKNKEWAETHHKKINQRKKSIDSQLVKESAKPRLISSTKSVRLTEIAQKKESAQLSQINQLLRTNNESSDRGRATPEEEMFFEGGGGGADGILSVYDRLAIRGRIQADKRMNFTPPPRSVRENSRLSTVLY